MSGDQRLSLSEALKLTVDIFEILRPLCDRVCVAGSVRREKSDVGDIEYVCVPKITHDLFGEVRTSSWIKARMSEHYDFLVGGEALQKYDLGPLHLELYITTPEKWGMIYTIRTGSAEFTHRLVTSKKYGGLMPSYLHCVDGRIARIDNGELLDTPEEKDVFKVLGIPWIEPKLRIK